MDLRKRISSLEAELSQVRAERAQLVEQREMEKLRSLKEMDLRKGSPQRTAESASEQFVESVSGATQRLQAISSLRRSITGEFQRGSDIPTSSLQDGRGSESRAHFDVDLVSADGDCWVTPSRSEDVVSPDGRQAWSTTSTLLTESTAEETPVPQRRSRSSSGAPSPLPPKPRSMSNKQSIVAV